MPQVIESLLPCEKPRLSSWFLSLALPLAPCPALTVTSIWGVKQQMKDHYLCFSNKMNIKITF